MEIRGEILSGPYVASVSGEKAEKLVIFLHGLGSNGADLIALAPHFAQFMPNAAFISPDAIEPMPEVPGGYQWFPLWERTESQIISGVHGSVSKLNSFIDEQLSAHQLTDNDLALIGFSQGSMVAFHVAAMREIACAGVAAYSGMLVDHEHIKSHAKSKPPIMIVHGSADDVVSAHNMGEAETTLKTAGFCVETLLRPGLGHGIDTEGILAGGQFLQNAFSASG